jgi:hypothetical protein
VLYFSGKVILVVELRDWTCAVVQRYQFVGFIVCISISFLVYNCNTILQSGRGTLMCQRNRYTNDEVDYPNFLQLVVYFY